MSLLRHVGTIGGLTMVSRVAGMAREMIFSRVLGANAVTDAWFQGFIIPNVFRRLFAEGAFSAAFVPMFSKRLHGEGGLESARSFSDDVLSVFLPILIALCAIVELAMPGVIWLLSDKPVDPTEFDLGVVSVALLTHYGLGVAFGLGLAMAAGVRGAEPRGRPLTCRSRNRDRVR